MTVNAFNLVRTEDGRKFTIIHRIDRDGRSVVTTKDAFGNPVWDYCSIRDNIGDACAIVNRFVTDCFSLGYVAIVDEHEIKQ